MIMDAIVTGAACIFNLLLKLHKETRRNSLNSFKMSSYSFI